MHKEGSDLGYSGLGLRKKIRGTEWGRVMELEGRRRFSGRSAPPHAPRRPWRSLHPAPGVCPAGRWQATGSRARRGRVLALRGRGRRLQLRFLDSARPGALSGPLALALSGRSLVQLRAPWDAALRGKLTEQPGPISVPLWWRQGKEDGARLNPRRHRQKKAEGYPLVDLSSSNRQF